MKQKFDVTGMTCGACVAHVEKAVKKLNGVQDVAVSLMTNSMQVTYNEEILNAAAIETAVANAGYGACPANRKQEARETAASPRRQSQE